MSEVKHIVKSMAGGYAVVIVQAIIGILMVPYLISDSALGIKEYGTLIIVQSSVALLGVLMDGWRLETARLIGKSVSNDNQILYELKLITLVLSLLMGGIYVTSILYIIPNFIVNINIAHDIKEASIIFVFIFTIEQVYYPIDAYLHAIRKSWVANLLSMADSIIRAINILVIFSLVGSNVFLYSISVLLSLLLKLLLVKVALRKQGYVQEKVTKNRVWVIIRKMNRAPTQTLQGLSPYIVFRGAIILSGFRLGAEQAGVISIIIQTIRNYFNQAIFSGLRPFILPFLASMQTKKSNKEGMNKFFYIYQIIVLIIGLSVAFTASIWFPLWIGSDLGKYFPLIWIAMIGYSLEVALLFNYYELIAEGKSQALAYLTFLGATIALSVLVLAPENYANVDMYIWVITSYICYWSLLIVIIKKVTR